MDKLIYTLIDQTYSSIWLPREESLNTPLSVMSAMLPAGGPRFARFVPRFARFRLSGEEFIVRWADSNTEGHIGASKPRHQGGPRATQPFRGQLLGPVMDASLKMHKVLADPL